MPLKIYTLSTCDTCRKAVKWLDANGVAYKQIAIRETAPSTAELKKMLKAMNGDIKKLFNTSGMDYKQLNMKDKLPNMSEAEAIELLVSNGMLVKRPFLLGGDVATVGFKEAVWAELMAKE